MSSVGKKYIIKEVIIPAGGGSKHVIQENAISFPSRTFLNFRGTGVNVLDGGVSADSTIIEVGGAGGGSTAVAIVADIAARNALTPAEGNLVFVEDATADGAVNIGWGFYIYENGAYRLFSSQEVTTFDNLLTNIVQSPGVGGIDPGTTMGSLRGQNHSEILTQIVFPAVPPVYTAPTEVLTGSDPKLIKIGDLYSPLLTATFTQNDAGTETLLEIRQGITPISNTSPFSHANQSFTIPGINIYTSERSYNDGPILNDSHGNPNATGQILGPGPVISPQVQYEGIYPYFWGLDTDGIVSGIDVAAGNEILVKVGATLDIDFNSSNTDFLWFAVPTGSTLFTKWFVNALNSGDIGGLTNLFTDLTIVQVSSGNFVNVNYDLYITNYASEVLSTMTLS